MAKIGRLLLQVKLAVFVLSNLRQHWQKRLCCRPLLQFTIQQLLVMYLLQMCKWLCPCWPSNVRIHQSWVPGQDTQLSCKWASIVAECVARFKKMADCHHSCCCNAASPDCDSSQSVRQVDISAQHNLPSDALQPSPVKVHKDHPVNLTAVYSMPNNIRQSYIAMALANGLCCCNAALRCKREPTSTRKA